MAAAAGCCDGGDGGGLALAAAATAGGSNCCLFSLCTSISRYKSDNIAFFAFILFLFFFYFHSVTLLIVHFGRGPLFDVVDDCLSAHTHIAHKAYLRTCK